MSAPEQKAPPAPVITRTRTFGSSLSACTAATSAVIKAWLSAFLTFGRFSVSHVTAPSRSVKRTSSDMKGVLTPRGAAFNGRLDPHLARARFARIGRAEGDALGDAFELRREPGRRDRRGLAVEGRREVGVDGV